MGIINLMIEGLQENKSNNRNNRGERKPKNGGKSSNRKRVSFEDEFEKGL